MNNTIEKPVVTQHLNLVVKVHPNSQSPEFIRWLLDQTVKQLEQNTLLYQDKNGKVEVEYVEPK